MTVHVRPDSAVYKARHKKLAEVLLISGVYIAWAIAFYCGYPGAFDHIQGVTVLDAIYFSMVTMSTVGYGDLKPSNGSDPLPQLMTLLYICVGVVIVFGKLSSSTHQLVKPIYNASRDFLDRQFPQIQIDLHKSGKADFKVRDRPRSRSVCGI